MPACASQQRQGRERASNQDLAAGNPGPAIRNRWRENPPHPASPFLITPCHRPNGRNAPVAWLTIPARGPVTTGLLPPHGHHRQPLPCPSYPGVVLDVLLEL